MMITISDSLILCENSTKVKKKKALTLVRAFFFGLVKEYQPEGN